MKSEADIIYNHVVGSISDKVTPIKLSYGDNFINILTQYACKTSKNVFKKEIEKHEAIKKAEFNAIVLRPYFARESEKWAKKIGVDIKYWSDSEHEKFKNYFMKKYEGLVK